MKNVTLNGVALGGYKVTVAENENCGWYGAADILTHYVKKYYGIDMVGTIEGREIVVGHWASKKFDSKIYFKDNKLFLAAGSVITAVQTVYAFFGKFLADGQDTDIVLPEDGTPVYETREPDWTLIPSVLTLQDKIVRSCFKMEAYLQYDHANGLMYSYQHLKTPGTIEEARETGNRTTNCVITMDWVLKDVGLFRHGILNHTYDGNCNYDYSTDEVKEACEKNFDIIQTNNLTEDELSAIGNLKPGDIIFFTDHNQIIVNKKAALDGGRGHCLSYSVGATFYEFVGRNPYNDAHPGFLFRAKDAE